MPHFIIECNSETLATINPETLVQTVFDKAFESGLFSRADIKSRLRAYQTSLVAGENHDFIHVWGFIREGRTDEQKRQLSESIVDAVKKMYEDIFLVSCDIQELNEASYVKVQL